MSKRTLIRVGLTGAVVVALLVAVYLSGLISDGDPFTGVWNVEGKPPDTGSLIRRTDDGYVYIALVAGNAVAWCRLERRGRTLVGETGDDHRVSFEYQPSNGHLVLWQWIRGIRIGPLELRKAADGSSVVLPGID
ncbi:MAG: hypothetical protein WC709_08745 [Thermoleophilia bacterium]